MILTSTVAAVVMDFLGINPVRALYWSAVINGVLAPFLLVAILLAASDKQAMMGQPSSALSKTVVGVATALMFVAAIAMFVV
jgi:Mn2+/Fe2+ NRAMP family transporter